MPLGWALYLPEDWCADAQRRRKAKIPDEVVFKTKPELGVELVERAANWDVPKAPVLGDHAYGENTWLRDRLHQAGCEYVLSVGPKAKVFEQGTSFEVPPKKAKASRGPVLPRPDRCPEPIGELISGLGADNTQTVTFRDGPEGEPVTSRFIFARVHAGHSWRDDPGRQGWRVHHPKMYAKISGATIAASDSMMCFGVSTPSLPQVIFSFGTAPEYEP